MTQITGQRKIEMVEEIISSASNVTIEEMRGHCRMREYVDARMVVWAIAKDYLGFSYPYIAKMYKRDHTTIIYGVQKIKQSPEYEAVIEKIRQKYPELLEKKAPSDGRPVGNWRF